MFENVFEKLSQTRKKQTNDFCRYLILLSCVNQPKYLKFSHVIKLDFANFSTYLMQFSQHKKFHFILGLKLKLKLKVKKIYSNFCFFKINITLKINNFIIVSKLCVVLTILMVVDFHNKLIDLVLLNSRLTFYSI